MNPSQEESKQDVYKKMHSKLKHRNAKRWRKYVRKPRNVLSNFFFDQQSDEEKMKI